MRHIEWRAQTGSLFDSMLSDFMNLLVTASRSNDDREAEIQELYEHLLVGKNFIEYTDPEFAKFYERLANMVKNYRNTTILLPEGPFYTEKISHEVRVRIFEVMIYEHTWSRFSIENYPSTEPLRLLSRFMLQAYEMRKEFKEFYEKTGSDTSTERELNDIAKLQTELFVFQWIGSSTADVLKQLFLWSDAANLLNIMRDDVYRKRYDFTKLASHIAEDGMRIVGRNVNELAVSAFATGSVRNDTFHPPLTVYDLVCRHTKIHSIEMDYDGRELDELLKAFNKREEKDR